MTLAEETATQIKPDTSPLDSQEAKTLAGEIPDWHLSDKIIERVFEFKDFNEAIAFVDDVADIADTQNHHPDIDIRYNKVRIGLSTHRIGGLSRNDFILAAKIDKSL